MRTRVTPSDGGAPYRCTSVGGIGRSAARADRRCAPRRLLAGRGVCRGSHPGLIQKSPATARWESPYRGVYRLAGAPRSWRQGLLAACLAAGDGAVASHRAAAALWRLPGLDESIFEISVPKNRRVRHQGLMVHQLGGLAPLDVTRIEAIPVTNPCRTLIDLAGAVPADTLEEALDDALRRRLVSLSRLRWRLAELGRRGRPGIGTIRTLVQSRAGNDGIPESVLETSSSASSHAPDSRPRASASGARPWTRHRLRGLRVSERPPRHRSRRVSVAFRPGAMGSRPRPTKRSDGARLACDPRNINGRAARSGQDHPDHRARAGTRPDAESPRPRAKQ